VRLRQPDTMEVGAFLFIPGAANVFPASIFLESRDESAKCAGEGASFLNEGKRLFAKIGWGSNRKQINIKLTAENDDADVNDVG
jgi:hypothetical protein